MDIRWRELDAGVDHIQQVVGDDAFERIFVPEAQPYP